VSERSGIALALRRFDNIKSSPQAAAEIADRWKHATHPNIIQLHGAWVHQRALFFTHDYHPGAQTLQERYLVQRGALIPESTVWAYICQLVTALRAIHALGLACRVIHPLRILWTSPNRIRINCVGVLDVLESDSQKTLEELQREDIFKLGRLILELTTRLPIEHLQRLGIQEALDGVAQHYSVEVVNLIKMLMQGQSSVYELCTMLTGQLVGQLDQTYAHSDALENELSKQFNSGRMLRVLLKTNLVNGRPEMGMDRNWSETGDRYVLSLFSNYLFHQHGPNGEPIVDYGHIIESLNKLDAGSTEKILLTSRGGKAVIVASFDEIRRCIHESFLELVRAGSGPGVLEEQQNVMYQEQQQRQMYQQMYAAQSGGGGGGVGGGMGGAGGYGGSMGGGVQGGQQYYGNSGGGGGGANPYANGGGGGGAMQQQGGYGGGSFMQHQ
jgi:PAB-dependent poly(A)-specific ribonuclease subunit 3|tara:strand:- start:654 stop:1979 length:1326 start_codon:yes stop_codon:yes gene_type:complete